MSFKQGTEFVQVRGCYIIAEQGKGTHIWNGSKIVAKEAPKRRKGRKNGKSL